MFPFGFSYRYLSPNGWISFPNPAANVAGFDKTGIPVSKKGNVSGAIRVTELQWVKSLDNNWLDLDRIDLQAMSRNPSRPQGVYIIWHGGTDPKIVRVGYGDIANKLLVHRGNPQITRYRKNGALMVTWAAQPDPRRQAGIANYLTEQFYPLVRGVPIDIPPMEIRSPFV